MTVDTADAGSVLSGGVAIIREAREESLEQSI